MDNMALTAKERDEYDLSLAEDLNELAIKFIEKANAMQSGRDLFLRFRICNDQEKGHFLEVRRIFKNKSALVFSTLRDKK